MKKLGVVYFSYACIVGGPLFLLLVVGTQAAHSTMEALLGVLLGAIGPMPMLLLGLGLWRGWRGAPILCVVAPLILGAVAGPVWGRPEPPYTAGLVTTAVFNARYSQLYYLPGATVLGLIVLGRAAWAAYRHGQRSQA